MDVDANPAMSHEDFLSALGDSLKNNVNADNELADILKAHILNVSPEQNAVTQAKAAILKLAAGRANPLKPEMANG